MYVQITTFLALKIALLAWRTACAFKRRSFVIWLWIVPITVTKRTVVGRFVHSIVHKRRSDYLDLAYVFLKIVVLFLLSDYSISYKVMKLILGDSTHQYFIRSFHFSGEKPLDFMFFILLLFYIYLGVTFLVLELSKQFKRYVIAQ